MSAIQRQFQGTGIRSTRENEQRESVIVDFAKLRLRVGSTEVAWEEDASVLICQREECGQGKKERAREMLTEERLVGDFVRVLAVELESRTLISAISAQEEGKKVHLKHVAPHQRHLSEQETDGVNSKNSISRAVDHDTADVATLVAFCSAKEQTEIERRKKGRTHPTVSNKHCSFRLN
jgi:hypothetical protein